MITEFCKINNLPSYRQSQFNKQYYQNVIGDFNELSDWPIVLREKLKEEIEFTSILPKKIFGGVDKTAMKIIFSRTRDKKIFETILLKHKDKRNTVCVSCMIGCPVGCIFCATGKMGFVANLSASEIIDQVLYFQRILKKIKQKISNVVFMGMGEPLLNWKEVQEAIKVITDPVKIAMSDRRLTISTCGVISGIKELMSSDFKGRLAISLHSANQKEREQLIPFAKSNTLDDLMNVLDEYVALTNKRVTYEYILLDGVNDSPSQAKKLVDLLMGRLAHINLIRYNEIKNSEFHKSTQQNVNRFCAILDRAKINYTVRVSLGSDIEGACGQLTTNNS